MTLLLANTIKVSAILLLALVASALLRRRSAAVRHWTLSVAIVCAVGMPLLAVLVPVWRIAPATWSRLGTAAAPSSPVSTTTTFTPQPIAAARARTEEARRTAAASFAITGADVIGLLWLAGAGVSLLILIAGLGRLKWLAARARRIDDGRWARLAAEVGGAFNLRRPVTLLQSDHPTLLVTWGVLQPKVILPAAAGDWPDDRARVVLRHELAHVRRGDWAVFMAAEVLRTVYWFNPLVWILCSRVRRESEHACDDVVLNTGVGGAEYAAHLLDLARTLNATRRRFVPALAAPAMARPSSLEGRVRTMLKINVNRNPLTGSSRWMTFVTLLGLTLFIAGAGAQSFFTLSGTVLDATNRVLPGTKLVVTNAGSGAKHEVRSDRTGHFEFVGLPPAEYDLEVAIPGFSTFRDKIAVAGRNIDRTIQLEVGSLEETITVRGSRGDAPDPAPPADAAGLREQARRLAQARQRAAVESCGNTPVGATGGQILAPMRLTDVHPRYPDSLRNAGVGGTVTMDAVIGVDGNIQEVRAIGSPHPDLESAAIEAVRQWQFTPTLLNCVPIEVRMKVRTNFAAQ
jgi:TonB family protein